jgi:hypothetical protein
MDTTPAMHIDVTLPSARTTWPHPENSSLAAPGVIPSSEYAVVTNASAVTLSDRRSKIIRPGFSEARIQKAVSRINLYMFAKNEREFRIIVGLLLVS